MRANGLDAVARAEDISVAGLTEVLFALPRILRIMRNLTRAVAVRRPAVAVLLDLPDFNLRLAKKIKKLGIPVLYYISPQVWAWRQSRVEQIRSLVDRMLVILPFEAEFFQSRGVPAEFVGHPLVEALAHIPSARTARQSLGIEASASPVVALLPGSRRKEITRHLPVMLRSLPALRESFPHLTAVIPVASTVAPGLIARYLKAAPVQPQIVQGRATEVLAACDVAVICSGTATLQAGLINRPMVVIYRVSFLTFHIVKRLVKVAFITIINLIAGHQVVRELIQSDCTPANIAAEVTRLLNDRAAATAVTDELGKLRSQLGQSSASQKVAERILSYVPSGAK